MVNLVKSHENMHVITYRNKISIVHVEIKRLCCFLCRFDFEHDFKILSCLLKGLAQAKIIKKSVILFRVLNMTI